ncbi:MAG TPA: LysR family transcriptional regulator, partial [Burkholderiaceae bacterium]|nr:LysR family transcriptional regulator [Burkholderiaceae bacterium]
MGKYTEIRSFVLVAEKGSFAAAARVEGVTPVVMGRRLNALEGRLGVQLVHRSTRGLTLTDLGEQFLEQCEQLLRDFDAAESSISEGRKAVSGRLVVSAPASFGRQHVAPHIIAFKERYPGLKLSFNFTDSLIDLVSEGYDMAIRVGEVLNPNYVAIKLFPNRRVVCGTPDYFSRYGVPETPEDLLDHNCLAFNLQGGQQGGWTFMRDGRTFSVRVDGDLD